MCLPGVPLQRRTLLYRYHKLQQEVTEPPLPPLNKWAFGGIGAFMALQLLWFRQALSKFKIQQ